MKRQLILTGWMIGSATAASANCTPPFTTLFACDIMNSQSRVEFCVHDPAPSAPLQMTYNFSTGLAAELAFQTTDSAASTKFMRSDDGDIVTIGTGAIHEGYVYAAFVTGRLMERPLSAQLHVYKSLDDFQNDKGEVEIERLYCKPETILIDLDRFGPG